MPRLSVIMSAYKSGETIERAARSTLRALPRDAELRVVVDGPDAPTEAALGRIDDDRLKVRVDAENKGLARQLQLLSDEVDAEYLGRMDSDDIALPGRFRLTLPALKGADFVFSSAIRFGNGPARPSNPLPLDSDEVATSLLFYNPLFHPTMVCRASVLREVGGYARVPYGEDLELWTRATARGARIVKVPAPTLLYRLSPHQMSAVAGADDRILAEPAFRAAHRALAERHGLAGRLDENGRLALDVRDREALVTRFKPWNQAQARRQISLSALVNAV